MLKTIEDAKTYLIDRIELLTKTSLPEEEKMTIEICFKNLFYDKLSKLISDEEIEKLGANSEEELEGKLFFKIPNYIQILEESAVEYLAEYFQGDYFDPQELTDDFPENK